MSSYKGVARNYCKHTCCPRQHAETRTTEEGEGVVGGLPSPPGEFCILEARRSVLLHSDVIFLFILKEQIYEFIVYLKEINHN